jgi:hypothetical protein
VLPNRRNLIVDEADEPVIDRTLVEPVPEPPRQELDPLLSVGTGWPAPEALDFKANWGPSLLPSYGQATLTPEIREAMQKAIQDAAAKQEASKQYTVMPDLNTIATDLFHLKKMLMKFLVMQNIAVPVNVIFEPTEATKKDKDLESLQALLDAYS